MTNIPLSAFCAGFASILSQIVLVKAVISIAIGSELLLGVVFASWLVWIAIGAFFYKLLPYKFLPYVPHFAFLLWAFSIVIIPETFSSIPILTKTMPGEYVPLSKIIYYIITGMAFPAFSAGIIFPAICRLSSHHLFAKNVTTQKASAIYQWEAIGFLVGGVTVTFYMANTFIALEIAWVAFFLLLFGFSTVTERKTISVLLVLVVLTGMYVLISRPEWEKNIIRYTVEKRLERLSFIGRVDAGSAATKEKPSLLLYKDTKYQNVFLTESLGQYVLYFDSKIAHVFPDPMQYEVETSIAMAQKPNARNVLIIGGNVLSEVPEFLKYTNITITLIENDPAINSIMEKTFPIQYTKIISNRRVKIVNMDPLRFLKLSKEKYDIIFASFPSPLTLASSRFWTKEFYNLVYSRLYLDGIFYTSLRSSERLSNYITLTISSIFFTMKEVFPKVFITAGDPTRFLAGKISSTITLNPEELTRRFGDVSTKWEFFRPEYFVGSDDFSPYKIQKIVAKITEANGEVNSIIKPKLLMYNMLFWAEMNNSRETKILAFLHKISAKQMFILFGIVIVTFLIIYWKTTKLFKGDIASKPLLMVATTGFSSMALEIMIVLIIQSLYGYIYSMIGIIIALFMFAVSCGGGVGRKLSSMKFSIRLYVFFSEITFIATICMVGFISYLSFYQMIPDKLILFFYFLVITIIGFLTGIQFPLGLLWTNTYRKDLIKNIAFLQVADHVGAAAGSFLISLILIPVTGFLYTCGIIGLLKVLSGIFLFLTKEENN